MHCFGPWHWRRRKDFHLLRRRVRLRRDDVMKWRDGHGCLRICWKTVFHFRKRSRIPANPQAGVPLGELMKATPRIPAFIVPIVSWGEREGSLAQATQSAHELLEGRIRMRNSLVSVLLPPLVLIFVAAAICLLVIGLFMPLVSLIQNLT